MAENDRYLPGWSAI